MFERPEYTIRIESVWFGHIAHGDVHVPYSKTIKRMLRRDLELIASSLSLPLYAFQAPSHDPKKRKFIRGLGFTFDHFRMTGSGERADMYVLRPLDLSKGKSHGEPIRVRF